MRSYFSGWVTFTRRSVRMRIIASRVLGITLTKRSNGSASSVELAGFPHHSLDTYLHKLVKAGYRVAICDQLEDPKLTKGIVKRGVTELVTPGVATSDKLLENKTNNFLAALHLAEPLCGIAFIDITTGEFYAAEGNIEYMDKLLQSFQPSEVILSKGKVKAVQGAVRHQGTIPSSWKTGYSASSILTTCCCSTSRRSRSRAMALKI